MKTNNMYLNRLNRFHFHLRLYHATEALAVSKGNSKVNHTSEVLRKLPCVFTQWEYDTKGDARLKSNPEMCTFTAAGKFFNLSKDELYSLFVPGYNEIFFGQAYQVSDELTNESLLANMLGFIHVKAELIANEEDEILTLKPNHYDKKQRKHQVSGLWTEYKCERNPVPSGRRAA